MDENLSSSLLNSDENTRNQPGFLGRIANYFRRKESDESSNEEPVPFTKMFRFASTRDLFLYFTACFCAFLVGLLPPVYIFAISRVTNIYVNEKHPVGNDEFLWRVWSLASIYCVIFVLLFVFEFVQHYMLTMISERIAQKVRSAFVASILSRNSYDHEESTGELTSQLNSHIDRMKEGLGEKIGLFVRCFSTFITCCAISFVLDWQTAFFLFWAGPIYIVTTALIPKLSKKVTERTLKISEEANGISEESILNVKTVASCNGQNQMIEKYSSVLESGVGAAVRVALSSAFLDATSNLLYFTFNSFGLWFATVSYHNGRVATAGDVFAVVYLALTASNNFSRLGPHVIALMKARIAAAKIYRTIDSATREQSEEEELDVTPLLDPSRAELHLEFRNVSFSFPSRAQPVLQSLSFELQPGKSIGLVGKSGCGKSTTMKLLTRFLESESGQILLDRKPLEAYEKKKWRQMMGVVSQEPCLFTGSIRENICLGRPFTDREVEAACRTAYAHEFIVALDKGYDTVLGTTGISLSGGQKQRIGIARAIVSNPRLLLLDEATSALDTRSERIVQDALDSASQGRSTIVIAHRLSTIKNVDEVIVMEDGEIVERGGYDELRTKSGGIFAKMVIAQEIERRKSRESHGEMSEEEESEDESVHVDDPEVELISHQITEQSFPTVKGGFLALLGRNKCKTAIIVLIGILRGFANPLFAARYFFVFGSLEEEHYETLLFWLMVGTMAVGVYNFILQLISAPISQYIGETMMNDLRLSALRSLLHRPQAYFDREDTSPAASAILLSQQPPLAISMIDNRLTIVVDGCFAAVGCLGLAFAVCLPTGFIGIAYFACYLLVLIVCEKFTDRAYKEVVAADKSGEIAIEVFDNVTTIQQLAVEDFFQTKYDEMMRRRETPLERKIRYQSIVHATNESIFGLFDFLATSIGIYFVYLGYYTTQMLFLAENVLSNVGWITFTMSQSFKEMVSASSAVKLVFSLIDPTIDGTETYSHLVSEGELEADSLSFVYPSQPNRTVLSDVSFEVNQGRSLAFVGPSGGGKSTIVNLLERFYDPTSGRLLLDSTPFTSLTRFQLRSNIALVGQEPILFRGTIADNIRLGVEGVSDEEVREACRLANAAQFIQDFPEGYETLVGEKGRSLSGGQKQRIAIARALVRDPKVIILDEATSALDTQSEKVVRSALESSARGRTSVMIAHRLDTIRHCDEICFVEGGRIMERGSHSELMGKRGHYYAMVEQQRMN